MHCPTMEEKAWDTTLFLSAIMHNMQVIHDDFFVFSAIFAGPRFVEIQKFCCHGNVTKRDLLPILNFSHDIMFSELGRKFSSKTF